VRDPYPTADSDAELRTAQQTILHLQQRLAEQQSTIDHLRATEQLYRDVFEIVQDYAFSFRVESGGTIVREWDTAGLERIAGYTRSEQAAEHGWESLIHPDDLPEANDALQRVLQGENLTITLRFLNKDGGIRWVRTQCCPVWDKQQERVTRFYGVGRDVTEEKVVQQQQARFMTNAMHELAHPVSSIIMRLYLMRRQPEKLPEHLDALEPLTEQMKRMIEDMREVSYLEQGLILLQKRPIDARDLFRDIVKRQESLASTRNVNLVFRHGEIPLSVMIDVERMAQAMSNMLANALNMTPANETVEIWVYGDPPDQPIHAVLRLYHHRLLMEADHPTLVFRPFHRASEGHLTHTGLELTLARELLRLHGGEATVIVDEHGKSLFHFRLPLN
jgi:PAS domain S-box-containing protein